MSDQDDMISDLEVIQRNVERLQMEVGWFTFSKGYGSVYEIQKLLADIKKDLTTLSIRLRNEGPL